MGRGPYSLALGDVNGDGNPDLVVVNFSSGDVSVLLGNGDGSFQAARNFPLAFRPAALLLGDFDNDGRSDVVVTSRSGAFALLLRCNPGEEHKLAPVSVAVGNFNGDGLEDLAVANFYSNNVSVLINNTPQPPGKKGRVGR